MGRDYTAYFNVEPMLKSRGKAVDQKKVSNNTYLVRRGEDAVAVRLHQTDVVTFHSDNSIRLDSGGWRTLTTKARINDWLPPGFNLWQERGHWYLNDVPYRDNICIAKDGKTIVNGGDKDEVKDQAKFRRKVSKFAGEFVDALKENEIGLPSGGDCWYCAFRTEDGRTMGETGSDKEHLRSHVEEKYFVPSLLHHALEAMSGSIAMRDVMLAHMYVKEGKQLEDAELQIKAFGHFYIYRHIKKMLARYMLRQLGMAT